MNKDHFKFSKGLKKNPFQNTKNLNPFNFLFIAQNLNSHLEAVYIEMLRPHKNAEKTPIIRWPSMSKHLGTVGRKTSV